MCDPSLLMAGGLAESLGDPLGTRKRREDAAKEDQRNRWAREDEVRSAQYAHEEKMAGLGGGSGSQSNNNRSSLGVQGGQGGNKSRYNPGTSQSGSANRAS